MSINWQFLFGLLLPAYGFGYTWLIKTAREDRPLYKEVEQQLKFLLVLLEVTGVAAVVMIAFTSDVSKAFKSDAASITAVFLLMASIVQQSFPFFRRIAALPPKTTEGAEKEEARIEGPA